jgi:hypothetical protein
MEVMQGKICEILPETADDVFAWVLAGGLEVRLPQKWVRKVLDVVSLGSDLEICGYPYCGLAGAPCVNAEFITNLSSRRSLSLRETPASPEASPCSPSPSPIGAAPLAPPFTVVGFEQDERIAVPFAYPSLTPLLGNILKSEQHSAATSVELGYDGLHRAQALIAYVRILDLELSDLTYLMAESKRTYEQGVASYERHEYLVANEFADASVELSRSVEVLVSRVLRADSRHPTLVPYPPRDQDLGAGAKEAAGDLARVERSLRRIHWLLRNGTLPDADREQV